MNNLRTLQQMVLLLLLQVLVLNHVHLFGYATPMMAAGMMLYFPRYTSRTTLLLCAFPFGLCVDMFAGTPGVCAGSLTLLAMMRPLLLRLEVPSDEENDIIPTYRTMGRWPHIRLCLLLLMVHLAAYHALEAFSLAHASQAIVTYLASLALSTALLLLLDTFRK